MVFSHYCANFISIHLNYSNKDDDYLLVHHEPVKETYALFYDNENFDNYVQFDVVPFDAFESQFNIIGSCNGLLCLSDDLSRYWDVY